MRIPFDLQDWLRDKSQKVETRDGRLVHNIWSIKEPCYTNNKKAEVCALIDGEEDALVFFEGGRYLPTTQDIDNPFDLFIVTPEPEMTAFEKKVYAYCDGKTVGEELIKRIAKELLDYARKELEPEVLERLEVAYKNQDEVVYENGKRDGKAEALRDLPMWRPAAKAYEGDRLPRIDWALNRLVARFEEGIYYLDIKELYNLPNCFEENLPR